MADGVNVLTYMRHLRKCAAVRTGFRCGATRGRQGACQERATWRVIRTTARGHMTLMRCDEHRPAWAEDGTVTPNAAEPCDCGLATAQSLACRAIAALQAAAPSQDSEPQTRRLVDGGGK